MLTSMPQDVGIRVLAYTATDELLRVRVAAPALLRAWKYAGFCAEWLRARRSASRAGRLRYGGLHTDYDTRGDRSLHYSSLGVMLYPATSEDELGRFETDARASGKTWAALSISIDSHRYDDTVAGLTTSEAMVDYAQSRVARCVRIVAECW